MLSRHSDGFDFQPSGLDGSLSVARPPAPRLDWIDELPVARILAEEFLRLGEYSCSIPTGVRVGKRWRRLVGSFDRGFVAAGGKPRWVIGEYVAHETYPTLCSVKWWRPIVVCRGTRR